jgi:hypothetical protein
MGGCAMGKQPIYSTSTHRGIQKQLTLKGLILSGQTFGH